MAKQTPNLQLKKPEPNDFYNVEDFNGNSDIIDNAIKGVSDRISGLTAADVGAVEVPHGTTPPAVSVFSFREDFLKDRIVLKILEPTNLTNWFETVVVRNTHQSPTTPTDGIVIFRNKVANKYDDGAITGFTDIVRPGQAYYYTAFTLNKSGAWNPANTKTLYYNSTGIFAQSAAFNYGDLVAPCVVTLEDIADVSAHHTWDFRDYEWIYFVFDGYYVYPKLWLRQHNTNLRAFASQISDTYKSDLYVTGSRTFSSDYQQLTLNITSARVIRTTLSNGAITVLNPMISSIYAIRKNNRP